MNIIRKAYNAIGSALGFENGQFVWLEGGRGSYSGRSVSPRSALQTVAVLRCVTLVSGAAASLPIDVFVKRGGRRVPEDNHAAEKLLDSTPNEELTCMDFRAMQWASFLLWGNAYAKIVWEGKPKQSRPIALWPLPADCVEVKRRDSGRVIYLYTPPGTGLPVPYEPEEILHVRGFSLPGDLAGMSVIGQIRNTIGRRQDQEEYGARFFSNGAKMSLAIEYPNKLGDKAIANMREAFQAQYGGVENAHKIAVLEQGATVKTLSVPPGDAQFLEQEQYTDEQIAMAFGVPPHMIGLLSKTTSWGTGIAEQKLGFMTFTLAPLLTFHEKAYERCLLSDTRESRFFIKHNLNAFLRADIKTRYEAYAIGVDKGFLNRNEPRAWEDLDPFGGGEKFTVQQQMIDIADMGKHLDAPTQGGNTNAQ